MDSVQGGAVSAEFAALSAALDCYLAAVEGGLVTRCSDADVLAEVRGFEALRRRLDSFELDVLPEVDRRGLPGVLGARGLANLLQGMLRLSPGAAKRRVEAVTALGPQVTVSGELLGPQLPVTAGAVRAGAISPEHVASIVKTLDDLPATLPVDRFADAEQLLVQAATRLGPKDLTNVGLQLIDTIDPDGAQPSEEEQRRHRCLTIAERRDGGVDGRFRPSRRSTSITMCPPTPGRPARRMRGWSRTCKLGCGTRFWFTTWTGCIAARRSWNRSWSCARPSGSVTSPPWPPTSTWAMTMGCSWPGSSQRSLPKSPAGARRG
jgi:hypothetical protein